MWRELIKNLIGNIEKKPWQSAVIQAFECNQNHVLVNAKLDPFSRTHVKMYVAGRHSSDSEKLDAAHQDSVIKQVEGRELTIGLREMNFISRKMEPFDINRPQQSNTNQVIIYFQFQHSPNADYKAIPSKSDLLDP